MKICIYGAGAIGGYLGVQLARAGADVSLVARGPHLAAMRESGLKLLIGDEESVVDESHSNPGRIEYPQYTRPRVFREMPVPEILLSGDHEAIARWRQEQSDLRSGNN